mmetsp:Transcript_104979/g.338530  ORF Transcript_104979/g.338530 Transcript_104979/m.338530 type:complete len:402 (-) Transcript_104979:105-1310(-)
MVWMSPVTLSIRSSAAAVPSAARGAMVRKAMPRGRCVFLSRTRLTSRTSPKRWKKSLRWCSCSLPTPRKKKRMPPAASGCLAPSPGAEAAGGAASAAGAAGSGAAGAAAGAKVLLLVSDSTGRTAQGLVQRLLLQHGELERPEVRAFSSVTDVRLLARIVAEAEAFGPDALVFATFADPRMAQWAEKLCGDKGVGYVDVMGPLLDSFSGFLEGRALGVPGGRPTMRKVSKMVTEEFFGMVEAVQFGQQHASGLNCQDWPSADLVLIGVSRAGKGPVAHYLAQRGVKVACLNLAPDEPVPPQLLQLEPGKVVLLHMQAEHLAGVRWNRVLELERRGLPLLVAPDYAEPERVRWEIDFAFELLRRHPEWHGPVDCTHLSVEECSSVLFRLMRAARRRSSPGAA